MVIKERIFFNMHKGKHVILFEYCKKIGHTVGGFS